MISHEYLLKTEAEIKRAKDRVEDLVTYQNFIHLLQSPVVEHPYGTTWSFICKGHLCAIYPRKLEGVWGGWINSTRVECKGNLLDFVDVFEEALSGI